jgi:erythromycin esterase
MMTLPRFSCAALSGLALACGSSPDGGDGADLPTEPQPEPVAQEIVDWLEANVVPFTTALPGDEFEDLAFLKERIGDARVVALGEATHGTREFFDMKHRLLRFLVKEMDFNTFAIEATWPESNRVNDYVHTGVGDARMLLSGLYFWIWNTEEVLDMIEWMRRHNNNPGDDPTVSFFGFDMQHPGMAVYNVETFLADVDPPFASFVRGLYDCIRPFLNDPQGQRTASHSAADPAVQQECAENVVEVQDSLTARRAQYEALSSAEAVARLLRSARIVLQKVEMDRSDGLFVRDSSMAENAIWLLEQAGPDAKIVLWAHNGHVNDVPGWMGSRLREEYGDDLVIVGFDFFEGSFTASVLSATDVLVEGPGPRTVAAPPADSYEYHFRAADVPRFVLDLRAIDLRTAATQWLAGPRRFRLIGCCFRVSDPLSHFTFAELPQEYDLLVYFQNSTHSERLPFNPPSSFSSASSSPPSQHH